MADAIGTKIPKDPTPNAILFSLGLGLIIPFFSSIFPIRNALGKTLSMALDINRSKSQAV
jgi:ABC-type antimicrobial peptide transport system permease subunit